MNYTHAIINALRSTTTSKWMWTAKTCFAILTVAFLVTGCGSTVHPH